MKRPPKKLEYTKQKLAPLEEQYGFSIGEHTYGIPIIHYYRWNEECTLTIGKFCCIALNVQIFLDGNHRYDWVTAYPFPAIIDWPEAHHISGVTITNGNVVIGNDVWIGQDSMILSGVTLGDGCVVGAGSVVTKSFPPYSIVAGNPATLVRSRFSEEDITSLLTMRWWDWPESHIRQHIKLLCSADIKGLYKVWSESLIT